MTATNPTRPDFTATSADPATPELLLTSAYRRGYELIGGRLVEKPGDAYSSVTTAQIALVLGLYLRGRRLGHVFDGNAGYQCFPTAPDDVRKPDLSFVRAGRFAGNVIPAGHCTIPPDLAIEVVATDEQPDEVEAKVDAYLAAGVRLVWIVDPAARRVDVRRPKSAFTGSGETLKDNDTLNGEDVLPGFACALSELFARD